MTSATLRFELLSYWHAGTGLRRGGDADALVRRDPDDGLPYLPGRSVKGLLREGVVLAFGPLAAGIIFGTEGMAYIRNPAAFHAHNAVLPADLRDWLRPPGQASLRAGLFDTFSSTAINGQGVAAHATLRVVELALPLTLEAIIEWDEAELDLRLAAHAPTITSRQALQTGARLIRSLGSHRHRGLGRCSTTLELPKS